MTIRVQTDFTQADSTTVVPAPTTGPTPTYSGTGAFGTIGNRLYASSAGDVRLIYAISQPDISVKCLLPAVGGDGCMMFRVTDANNFMMVRFATTSYQVYRCVAGSFTQMMDLGGGSIAAGDIAEARAYGENIEMYRNGVGVGSIISGYHLTGGGVGFRCASGDTGTRFDDFLARDVADVLTATTLGVSPLDLGNMTKAIPTAYVYKGRDTAAADTGSAA